MAGTRCGLIRWIRLFLAILAGLSVGSGHATMPMGTGSTPDNWRDDFRRPKNIPFPDDNPYGAAKATLGRALFFDPALSGTGTRSCASCHQPGLSWGDGLAHAVGSGGRMALRSPTLLNLAWIDAFGWDGKFDSIEAVAFSAILGHGNMDQTEPRLLARLAAIPGYARAFERAFADAAISRRNVELALATFERTIVSAPTPFDRWIEGDEAAISDPAKRGFEVFRGRGHCAECHSGWNFTDGSFQDIGLPGTDIGRGALFANSVALRHAFKVPTLRDVARRMPYMHDGSVPTLAAVVDLYDGGGTDRPSRSPLIRRLGLGAEDRRDLVEFLATLTGDPVAFASPVLPR